MRLALSAFALALACGGCSMMRLSNAVVQPAHDWRAVATEADRNRLRDWRGAFTAALAAANRSGHAAEIAKEGPLLKPDAAIGGPIPDGTYRCRVIKLGAKSGGMLDYIAYPYFSCRIQQKRELQSFAKLNGSQRQVGIIFPHDQLRSVFLGTLTLGDEARATPYGVDPDRDVVGYVERIGEARWRLVMPYPHFESQLDVMELVPAS
jgi:hypothetical protein